MAAAGLGLSFVFLAQADSAYNSRREIAQRNGSAGDAAWACKNPGECRKMSGLREDQGAAQTWWGAMIGLSGAAALTGTVLLIAHLVDSAAESKRPTETGTRLIPAAGPNEAGLRLQGTF